jgi:hypothetical protein
MILSNLKILVLIPGLFLGIPSGTIKKAKEDFAAINKVFTAEKLSVEMVYNFYEQHNEQMPIETKKGVFYKKGTSDYSKLMETETLHTPDLTITNQIEDKIMVVSDPVSSLSKLVVSQDTILSLCKEIGLTDLPDNSRRYELKFAEGSVIEFKKLELIFEPSTYRLRKVTLFFWEQDKIKENGEREKINPKVEIIYKNYNKVNVDAMNVFSASNYVSKTAPNKYKASGKYASYAIYNQKLK